MAAICPPDWSKCTKKCCFDIGAATKAVADCDKPCACYGENVELIEGVGCAGGEGFAPCIAVIDETSPGYSVQTADWNAFRAAWPNRPFYVLVPGNVGDVILPGGFDGVRVAVNRDNGNAGAASDWFTIINLEVMPAGPVFLFIDNSGSMTTSTVQASYDLFSTKCAQGGYQIYSVTNGAERYIEPFISALVPTTPSP
jgi:hypothetical protein